MCAYINTYNQATDFIYAGINKTEPHVIRPRIFLYHIIDTVMQNISIVNQWTQKISVDHQEVPACCGGIHDQLVFIFLVINYLCKHFPNHVGGGDDDDDDDDDDDEDDDDVYVEYLDIHNVYSNCIIHHTSRCILA